MQEKNLSDLRVLDFTRVLAGPYLTQMLCDLGAEIIRIEQPKTGSDERFFSPIHEGQSGYYMMLGRGKKSITLNLKDPKAKEIVFKLLKHCDIVTENFKPGVMASLGFSYEELRKVKPDIIMCSVSTFGQEGPYSKLPGYDIIAQAMSGLMWMTGDVDRPPMRSGTSIGDVNAASHALGAILAALHYRTRTGKGQYIDISLRDCLSAILETGIVRHTLSHGKDNPHRSGAHHATMAPYGVFHAGNGQYVVMGALSVPIWNRICEVMNCPELKDDPNYNTPTARAQNLPNIITMIESWLQAQSSVKEAVAILSKNAIPCAPVQSIADLMEDPQFLMRDMLVEVNDPILGPTKLPCTPMRFSETTVYNPVPPPRLGEFTAEVLMKYADCSAEEVEKLRQENVI